MQDYMQQVCMVGILILGSVSLVGMVVAVEKTNSLKARISVLEEKAGIHYNEQGCRG